MPRHGSARRHANLFVSLHRACRRMLPWQCACVTPYVHTNVELLKLARDNYVNVSVGRRILRRASMRTRGASKGAPPGRHSLHKKTSASPTGKASLTDMTKKIAVMKLEAHHRKKTGEEHRRQLKIATVTSCSERNGEGCLSHPFLRQNSRLQHMDNKWRPIWRR